MSLYKSLPSSFVHCVSGSSRHLGGKESAQWWQYQEIGIQYVCTDRILEANFVSEHKKEEGCPLSLRTSALFVSKLIIFPLRSPCILTYATAFPALYIILCRFLTTPCPPSNLPRYSRKKKWKKKEQNQSKNMRRWAPGVGGSCTCISTAGLLKLAKTKDGRSDWNSANVLLTLCRS